MRNNKNFLFIAALKKAQSVLNTKISSPLLLSNFSTITNTTKKRKLTKMESLLLGAKKAWLTPTLPEDMLKLQTHPLIRILRTLGGSSFLILLPRPRK